MFYGISAKQSKVISVLICMILNGCGTIPGMQNMDTTVMLKAAVPQKFEVHPSLIPITPTLIADQKIRRYHYRIAPADVLDINVWQHPEFDLLARTGQGMNGTSTATNTSGYLVNSEGNIFFPLIGYVDVGGKTMEQVRSLMSVRLKTYINSPQINVRVADFRGQKVYVLGEVLKPGFLPITDQPLTIADALTLSGSINPDTADPRYIYVIRGNYLAPKIFWLDAKTPDKMLLAERFGLHPQDIVYVSSAPATRWNRVLNQLLPTVQTIWYTQAIIRNS